MSESAALQENVVQFPQKKKALRKAGLNRNRKGSVRSINGKLYVDFIYLGERVREKTGLDDTKDNVRQVRQQLDKVITAIESGTFRFADVFPKSSKKDHFRCLESDVNGFKKAPGDVNFKEYAWQWYNRLKEAGRVSQRTLLGYKTHLESYLGQFFGKMTFGDLDPIAFEKFVVWAKKQRFRKKSISNETVNKLFVPLKTICKSARSEFKWVGYDPFYDFKKLPQGNPYEKIAPFSIAEQMALIESMPDHWKPYFLFAFSTGLRQGEQIGLKPSDIDWEKKIIHIRRGITMDENGKIMEGPTKNNFSRRDIKFTPVISRALEAQKAIYEKLKGEYLFSGIRGHRILPATLRKQVWILALKKANIPFREMKQTRHSFASIALSCGESPLWIAKTMGHRDTDMIIRVYGKYVENARSIKDGALLDAAYQYTPGNHGDEQVG